MEFRYKRIREVFWLSLAVSLLMTLCKLVIGLKLRNLAVLADSVHSLLEGGSSAIGLVVMYTLGQPAAGQANNRGKFEILAAILLSGLFFLSCWEILGSAFERLFQHTLPPKFSWWGILFLLGSLGIHHGMQGYKKGRAFELSSPLLAAGVARGFYILISTVAALASVVASAAGWAWFDAYVAVGIILMAALSAYSLIDTAIDALAGARRQQMAEEQGTRLL
ncbi:MAG: cation transporter [Methylacidiphilales bacterium]|nr:cation transporter [Candidatus Methylacidiphilales bacterium]